jgi:hypothetical protein
MDIRVSLIFPRDRGRVSQRPDAAGTGQNTAPGGVCPSLAASASQDRSGRASSAASASEDHADGRRSAGSGQDASDGGRSTSSGQDATGCGRSARTRQADACRASSATSAGQDCPASRGSSGAIEGSSVARQDRAYAPRLRRLQPSRSVSNNAVSGDGGWAFSRKCDLRIPLATDP